MEFTIINEECCICYEIKDLIKIHDEHYCCSDCYKRIDKCPLCRITITNNYNTIEDEVEEEDEDFDEPWYPPEPNENDETDDEEDNDEENYDEYYEVWPYSSLFTRVYVPDDFSLEARLDGLQCISPTVGRKYWVVYNEHSNYDNMIQKWNIRCFTNDGRIRKYQTLAFSQLG